VPTSCPLPTAPKPGEGRSAPPPQQRSRLWPRGRAAGSGTPAGAGHLVGHLGPGENAYKLAHRQLCQTDKAACAPTGPQPTTTLSSRRPISSGVFSRRLSSTRCASGPVVHCDLHLVRLPTRGQRHTHVAAASGERVVEMPGGENGIHTQEVASDHET
jgi:hypothetical protein